MGAQVCQPDGTFGPCECVPPEFERIRKGMVGQWAGTETTPFTAPYRVFVTFTGDGHYAASCAQMTCLDPVFYYGSDANDPSKTYMLIDLHADGTGTGHIVIFFGPGDIQTGDLDAVTLSADGNHLQFQFWETWNGRIGPFVFDLRRLILI
jgi:hypothetical protein